MRMSEFVVMNFLALMLPLAAQDQGISVVGTAQDFSGVAIPHARAELQSERSHERVAQAQADNSGMYRFVAVHPGDYTLKLQAAGFAQLTVRSIQISGRDQRVLPPITMMVGLVADCGGHGVLYSLRALSSESQFGSLRGSIRLYQRRNKDNSPPVPNAGVTLICTSGLPCGATHTDS